MKSKISLFTLLLFALNLSGQTWQNPTSTQSQLYFNVDGSDPSIIYETGVGFVINTKYQDAISFTDGAGTYSNFFINGLNNKVGVGTSDPKSKFHVMTAFAGPTPHYMSDLTVEDSENVMLSLITANDKSSYYAFADSDDDFVGGIQYSHSNDKMFFRVNNHTADMVIDQNGRVAIGKTSAASEFDVEGGIRSSDGNDNVTLRSVNAESHSEIV